MIVRLDASAFFASVEQAADPKLRGKAVAVGGERRGIIASASYEASRLGIFTPMPTVRARKLCLRLIVLQDDFEKYEQFSRFMFSYAYDFTPEVEVASIDEGYFDLRGQHRHSRFIACGFRASRPRTAQRPANFLHGSLLMVCVAVTESEPSPTTVSGKRRGLFTALRSAKLRSE